MTHPSLPTGEFRSRQNEVHRPKFVLRPLDQTCGWQEDLLPRFLLQFIGSSRAECRASGSPREPEFQMYDRFPIRDNDVATTTRVSDSFDAVFGSDSHDLPSRPEQEFL
jgi:hypothetical protein